MILSMSLPIFNNSFSWKGFPMIIKPQKFESVGIVKAGKPIKFAKRVFRKAKRFFSEKYLWSLSKRLISGGKMEVVGAMQASNEDTKSKNSAFLGEKLKGFINYTISKGFVGKN